MTNWTDTSLAVSKLTDEGLFESLATDVLRVSVPAYAHLAHTGINAGGKTRKAPVDGISFEPGASPPHLVVVHHTITVATGLERKWLHDPSLVIKRKPKSADAPAGDVLKSIEVIERERGRRPELRATLVLTTNAEPDETVVLNVQAVCAQHDVEVDIWTRTRIAGVLDTTGDGQWVRQKYLGARQQRLSADLLARLGSLSLDIAQPTTSPAAWTARQLDLELASIQRPVTFLVGRSGSGKTVACHRYARQHLAEGGFALILPADVVDAAATLEMAVGGALSRLAPALACDESPWKWSSPGRPLLLVVEDINRSGQAVRLMEKIARWGLAVDDAKGSLPWRLICPTWPQVTSAADHSLTKSVEAMTQLTRGMTAEEGRSAVDLRARSEGRSISPTQANGISEALGHDPLLIGLYDFDKAPSSHTVIADYVLRELRALERSGRAMAIEYQGALRALSIELLSRLQLEPTVFEALEACANGPHAPLLRELIGQCTVLYQQPGPELDSILRFRHDRVRDWLFVDALAHADAQKPLTAQAMEDPFLAEIVGATLAVREACEPTLSVAAKVAPLALFHALRTLPPAKYAARQRVLAAIEAWLIGLNGESAGRENLLWECLSTLSRTDDPAVPDLVRHIPYRHPIGWSAAVRNGDVAAGAILCERYEPGMTTGFRDFQIAHALHRHGDAFLDEVSAALRSALSADGDGHLSGLLRLAGHLGSARLGPAVFDCWKGDPQRAQHLREYLWALARCCEAETAEALLGPLIELWAELSDEEDSQGRSERNSLAVYNVDWAFARSPPAAALSYLIKQADRTELRRPITFMLRGVRDEQVLDMFQDELAGRYRESAEHAFHFRTAIFGFGERETRLPDDYRARLLATWNTPTEPDSVRRAAFDLWAMGVDVRDLGVLLSATPGTGWEDRILQTRLKCGDRTALPGLIARLERFSDLDPWWWQYAVHVEDPEVLRCLDRTLEWRRSHPTLAARAELDWHLPAILRSYDPAAIEAILVKHWDHVAIAPQYILTALFAATERTKQMAASAIQMLPSPREAFRFITMGYGIKQRHRVGVTRREQIEALAPYVSLIAANHLAWLAEECSRQGWNDTRERVLGAALAEGPSAWSSERARTILDALAADSHRWVRHEIDRLLKVHVTWPDLLSDLTRWYLARQSIKALSFVAEAIEYRGSRADLEQLTPLKGAAYASSLQIIADTTFAVRRRVA